MRSVEWWRCSEVDKVAYVYKVLSPQWNSPTTSAEKMSVPYFSSHFQDLRKALPALLNSSLSSLSLSLSLSLSVFKVRLKIHEAIISTPICIKIVKTSFLVPFPS